MATRPATGRPTGRPKKPAERIAAVTGSAPMPGAGLDGLANVPPPPRMLRAEGKRAWTAIWTGAKSWLSADLDPLTVEMAARDWQEAAELRRKIDRGLIPRWTENEQGRVFAHPAVQQLRDLEVKIAGWMASLGLTPSDRSRLGLAQVRVKDELDDLTQRRRARDSGRSADTATS